MRTRRTLLAACMAALACWCGPATAQAWPAKPIRIILPFAAGGGGDTVIRPLSQKLSEGLGVPIILENVTGAAGALGMKTALSAPADGYTFVAVSNSHTAIETLSPGRGYNLLKDFVAVSEIADLPIVLVTNPKVPVRDLPSLVAYAKSNPGKLSYATPGIGTVYHLITANFAHSLNLSMLHVPYRSSANARQDVAGGQVDLMFDGVATMKPFIDTSRVRGIAVGSLVQNPMLPELTPIASLVPGFSDSIWVGLMARAGTPPQAVKRMQDELAKVLANRDIAKSLETAGAIPAPLEASAFTSMLQADIDKWARTIKAAEIKAE
jgi:tripartite-type tricarboxylate transporter receptor subunit TctC